MRRGQNGNRTPQQPSASWNVSTGRVPERRAKRRRGKHRQKPQQKKNLPACSLPTRNGQRRNWKLTSKNQKKQPTITGPFSILVGYTGGLMALNDRLKLRSMVVGEKDETVYIASEECAIRVIAPELDKIWAPRGGEAVIVNLNDGGNK